MNPTFDPRLSNPHQKNPQFLREKRVKLVEEKLAAAIAEARIAGIGPEELARMLELLYEEAE